jgi:LmbE family N-acetylglucosaminyl deacetylase
VDRQPLTLVGCFAHPDDETWSLGGSFALLVPKGIRGAVWTATRGQAGEIADGSGATRETLAAVREAELRAAMDLVGVAVELGDFVDGQLADADRQALTLAVHDFLERWQPDVVVTMEPGGVTAHPDHQAVTAAVQAAFAAYAARPRPREPRLYYWGVTTTQMTRWRELGEQLGVHIPGPDEPFGAGGTPDAEFTCTVSTAAVAERVHQLLGEHRSQAGDPGRAILAHGGNWREVFSRASYIRVHPAPQPDDPHETSLVEAFTLEPADG